MTRLEMHVRTTDGRSHVERVERADAVGRRAIDRAAFAALARSDVERVEVVMADRVATRGGKGRAR